MSAKRDDSLPPGHWIYLFSSNAEREYILDALEVLFLPRAAIQHYRYDFKHLDPDLQAVFETDPRSLVGRRVFVSYLCQEEYSDGGEAKWRRIELFPMRLGTMVDAYKVGKIAHFHFEVGDYVDYSHGRKNIVSRLERALDSKTPPSSYACSSVALEALGASADKDAITFQAIVDSTSLDHFRISRLTKTISYDPVFLQFPGLHRIQQQAGRTNEVDLIPLLPAEISGLRDRAFRLGEDETYVIRLNTYLPSWSQVPSYRVDVTVGVDQKHFSTPGSSGFVIGSRYDSNEFFVSPAETERAVWTFLKFEVKVPEAHSNVLGLSSNFPVRISPRAAKRRVNTILDISEKLGIAILPLSVAMWSRDMPPALMPWYAWFLIGLGLASLKYLRSLVGELWGWSR